MVPRFQPGWGVSLQFALRAPLVVKGLSWAALPVEPTTGPFAVKEFKGPIHLTPVLSAVPEHIRALVDAVVNAVATTLFLGEPPAQPRL